MSDPTASAVSADPGTAATPATPATPSANPMDIAVQNLMARKGMQSMQPPAQGEAPPAAEPPAAVTPPPEAPPEPTEPVISTPKNEREYLDRLASKDAKYQAERNANAQLKQRLDAMEQQHNAFYTRLAADPIAAMAERGVRFSDVALRAAGKTPEGKKEPPAAALPPDVAAEFEELKKFRATYEQTQQQQAHQANRDHQLGLVKGLLEKDTTNLPLVNELGKYGDVLDRVAKHVGHHGEFADDRTAEEVVAFYARQVETEARRDMLQHATKPGVKAWLAKELGYAPGSAAPPQREATPARPEIEGNQAQPNPRPALSNHLTTQRTTAGAPEPWDKERARQQAVAEMSQVAQAQRATH